MATYKQPTTVATPVVGVMPVKEALKANISVANQRSNEYPGTKTAGVKTRGNGAATKGTIARGPMV